MASDAFISYRREGGAETARLIRRELASKGFTSFLDVDDLEALHFDDRLLREIEQATNFIVILSPGSLDRCANEDDWLGREIAHAIATDRNIVPVMKDGFEFPPKSSLSDGIADLCRYSCVVYSHVYFDATMDKLVKFLKTTSKLRPAPADREEPDYAPARDRMENSLGNLLVRIPEQHLVEGYPPGQPFFVSSTCVSNRDYREFVRAGGPSPLVHALSPKLQTWKGEDCPASMLDHPVVFVEHKYARKFCDWLTNKERKGGLIRADQRYSLPSWKQWVAFSSGALLTEKSVISRTWVTGHRQPTEPVLSGEPSPLGLYHLFGNVFEWCTDEETRKVWRSGKLVLKPTYIAIGGGWASSYDWLQEMTRKKNYGAIWCPSGWLMKDGGFRICLGAESPNEETRSSPGRRRKTARKKKKK